jgi:hypothetical protein
MGFWLYPQRHVYLFPHDDNANRCQHSINDGRRKKVAHLAHAQQAQQHLQNTRNNKYGQYVWVHILYSMPELIGRYDYNNDQAVTRTIDSNMTAPDESSYHTPYDG